MARTGENRSVQKELEVNLCIEIRPANYEQLEAGKRLFKSLVEKAKSKDSV